MAPEPLDRWPSATALARALEEATLRAAGDEGSRPYPGLAAFEREDAEFFFGRELEVEAQWRKLEPARLLAVVGPSGAGKSSFVRAGLLPSLPESWGVLVATPGTRPFVALARALAEFLPSDPATVDSLLRFEELEPALALVSEWRRRHAQCLLVLDQFEELFTLCPHDVQAALADFLGRLPIETDVHVLLSMRDDFLLHCQRYEPLRPVFSHLTPIGAPTGAALRRAIVHPARKCGYRFEDEALVEEVLAEVEGERGSLPTLAFAMAKLWELRDRERGLLTRQAYDSIGGVGGALAQHAEATLGRVGKERIPIVRELFRNLVTAQGTRAKRTRHQLLSVFGPTQEHEEEAGARSDEEAAPAVLDSLIDARLLTSYEVPGSETDREHRTEIEVIHESLLDAWPRLERWQMQDAENAELRDQLRRAARLWRDRGMPEDLLWTGTFYREFELWRERYPGGLSSEEEEFATAMRRHAERRKRRHRTLTATVISSLILGMLLIGTLWRQAATARDRSRSNELRARASQLLALGRLELDRDRTAGLAYTIASLEQADSATARRAAVEVLSKAPTAFVLDSVNATCLDFSPDGRWLAAGYRDGHIAVWSRDGEQRVSIEPLGGLVSHVQFVPGEEHLLSVARKPDSVSLWSIPEGEMLRRHAPEEALAARVAPGTGRVFVFTRRRDRVEVEVWPPDGGPAQPYGDLPATLGEWGNWPFRWGLEIDRSGRRLAFVPILFEGPDAGYDTIELWEARGRRFDRSWSSGRLGSGLEGIALSSDGSRLAGVDQQGRVRVWSLGGSTWTLQRELRMFPGKVRSLVFDSAVERLAAAHLNAGHATLWNLDAPGSTPLLVHRDPDRTLVQVAFDPGGTWLATAGETGVAAYPIERRYPRVLEAERARIWAAAFLPDGSAVAASFKNNTIRLWPLSDERQGDGAVVAPVIGGDGLRNLVAAPDGRSLLGADSDGNVWWVPLDGGRPRVLGTGSSGGIRALTLGARIAAAADSRGAVLVLDLAGGEPRTRQRPDPFDLELGPDGSLFIADAEGIHLWQLGRDGFRTISERPGRFDLSVDGRFLLAAQQGEDGEAALYDLELGTRRELDRHGTAYRVAIGPQNRLVATLGEEIRVGPITGERPHLVIGPRISPMARRQSTSGYGRLEFSPDGRWIASVGRDLVLWPVPDVLERPLHALPYEELLSKLRSLTNLRVVADPASPNGWSFHVEPFPGWEETPTW